MKYWEIIADRLSKAGWSLGWVSAIDSAGRTIWIALTAGLQKVSAQLAAASPSHGGLEASRFATGRIRGGGPAPQMVNNP